MLYYNWGRLQRAGKNDPKKIMSIFKKLVNGVKDKDTIKICSGVCDSYVLNEQAILSNKLGGTPMDLTVYLYVASKRNYLMHKMNNISYVYVGLLDEGYTVDLLKNNKLLNINEDKIYLRYEE